MPGLRFMVMACKFVSSHGDDGCQARYHTVIGAPAVDDDTAKQHFAMGAYTLGAIWMFEHWSQCDWALVGAHTNKESDVTIMQCGSHLRPGNGRMATGMTSLGSQRRHDSGGHSKGQRQGEAIIKLAVVLRLYRKWQAAKPERLEEQTRHVPNRDLLFAPQTIIHTQVDEAEKPVAAQAAGHLGAREGASETMQLLVSYPADLRAIEDAWGYLRRRAELEHLLDDGL
jgi:hypothetical protein